MKNQSLLSIVLALTVAGCGYVSPVLAQSVPLVEPQESSPPRTIPQSAAIVVTFASEMNFKVDEDQSQPTTLLLANPIVDSQGNTIAPANSPVQARLVPVDNGKGVQIYAEALVSGGQMIPIQAVSAVIPSQRITLEGGDERAAQNAQIFQRIGGSITGAAIDERKPRTYEKANDTSHGMRIGSLIGNAVGLVSGLASPRRIRVVQIPQSSVYVLTLQAPITLAGLGGNMSAPQPQMDASRNSPSPSIPSIQLSTQTNSLSAGSIAQPAQMQQAQPTSTEFNFRSVRQYTETVEQILAGYQQGKLSAQDAQALVASADKFATTRLNPPLYPLAGVRQQVTEKLGLTYIIDR
jgi:hypothetical protein